MLPQGRTLLLREFVLARGRHNFFCPHRVWKVLPGPGVPHPHHPLSKEMFLRFWHQNSNTWFFWTKKFNWGEKFPPKNPARKENVVRVYIYICTSRSLQENLPAPTVAQPPIGVSKKIQMLTLAIWQGPPFVLGAPFFLKKFLASCPFFFFFLHKNRKTILRLLCWEGSTPLGSEHTRAEAHTTCVLKKSKSFLVQWNAPRCGSFFATLLYWALYFFHFFWFGIYRLYGFFFGLRREVAGLMPNVPILRHQIVTAPTGNVKM